MDVKSIHKKWESKFKDLEKNINEMKQIKEDVEKTLHSSRAEKSEKLSSSREDKVNNKENID